MPAMGSSTRLADLYARYGNEKYILQISQEAPLQSLSAKELELEHYPLTVYPKPKRCKVWVRFGPHPFRVDARLVRSTPLAAGVEFTLQERTFRCWVWGPACEVVDGVVRA